MEPEKIIEKNRKKIDKITEKLIALISERDKLVLEIGKAKKKLGMSISDRKREEKILQRAKEIAKKKKVDVCLVERIMKILIEHAKKIQRGIK